MNSPDFAYFISFCIFLIAAYKLGFRRAKAWLDEKIEHISKTMEQATQQKEIAILTLNELKYRLSELENNQKIHIQELDLRGKELTHEHHIALEHMIQDREHHQAELLAQELRLHKKKIQEALLKNVFQQLKNTMITDKEAQTAFHKQAMDMLHASHKHSS